MKRRPSCSGIGVLLLCLAVAAVPWPTAAVGDSVLQELPLAPKDTLKPGRYAMHKASCKPFGSEDRDSDGGLRNLAKRFIAKDTEPIHLTLAQFKELQQETDPNADHAKQEFLPRTPLESIHIAGKTLGEGDRVSVSGVVNRAKSGAGKETVNCAGADGKDIHINIGPAGTRDERKGIVVEMIPQLPMDQWRVGSLGRVMASRLPVLVIGSLTYDNDHILSTASNQPKRMSLWEIHPVLAFYVCPKKKTCDPEKPTLVWQTLKAWALANPK